MNRMWRGLIIGGAVASIAGLLWKSSRNNRMISRGSWNGFVNGTLNSTMNLIGKLGLFRIMGRSRFLNRMVR